MNWIIFRFFLIGPAAGALGFVATDQLLDASGFSISSLASPGSIQAVPLLTLYGLVLAYSVGGLPTVICGALYAAVMRRRKSNFNALMRPLAGGLLGLCVAGLFGSIFFLTSRHAPLLSWTASGLLGGALSAFAVTDSLIDQRFKSAL